MRLSRIVSAALVVTSLLMMTDRPVSAATSPAFSWKVSHLTQSARISPSTVWRSVSEGSTTWTASGTGCSRTGRRIVTLATGRCKIIVTLAATSAHRRTVKTRTFNVVNPNDGLTCATGGLCAVGDVGPGGGLVFYVSPTAFTSAAPCGASCRYLEAAPRGWGAVGTSRCTTPGTSTRDPRCRWLENSNNSVETKTGIGDGYANTDSMFQLNKTAGYAGTVAWSYWHNGKTDWFLPSKDELNELCKFARQLRTGDPNVICLGAGDLRNGFRDVYYWSSSQTVVNGAWYQYFFDGFQGDGGKVNSDHVRPVRAF